MFESEIETDAAERAEVPAGTEPLTARARVLATQISVLQAELVSLVGALADTSDHASCEVPADMTAMQWLCFEVGLRPAEANRALRLARRLSDLPQLTDAFASGGLSEGIVDLLASVATAENEAELLATARVASGRQLETIVRTYRHQRTPDSDDVEADRFTRGWTDGGRYRFSGDVHAALGAHIDAAMRAARDADRHDREDGEGGDEPVEGEVRPSERPRPTQAQLLESIIDTYLAGHTRADGTLPERFQGLITLDAEKLGPAGPLDDALTIDLTTSISAHEAARAACDAIWRAVVMRHGRPITITEPRRLATPAQKAAVLARDRHCTFPGCGRTRALRFHHVIPHPAGGPTQIDNLVALCQQHHTLIHKPGWTMRANPVAGWTITRPDGTALRTRARLADGRPPPASPPLQDDAGDRRWLPSGDHLTAWALDITLHHWLTVAA